MQQRVGLKEERLQKARDSLVCSKLLVRFFGDLWEGPGGDACTQGEPLDKGLEFTARLREASAVEIREYRLSTFLAVVETTPTQRPGVHHERSRAGLGAGKRASATEVSSSSVMVGSEVSISDTRESVALFAAVVSAPMLMLPTVVMPYFSLMSWAVAVSSAFQSA